MIFFVLLTVVSLSTVFAQPAPPQRLRIVDNGYTPPSKTRNISQYGITWTFDKEYEYGQYVNGDYWVVGPVKIVAIDPRTSRQSDGRIVNGSMVNPRAGLAQQGFDSTRNYVHDLNVAWEISSSKYLEIEPETTLISSISDPPNTRPYLKTAAILTVVSASPPSDGFRPGYSDPEKVVYRSTNLNRYLLKSLPPVAGTPTLKEAERLFERPWLDWIPDWDGGYLHPLENMPDYGREIAKNVGIGGLMLHVDYPIKEKETLLIRYVQLGIDLFSIADNGGHRTWLPNGGHASGRKWPILFAGMMIDNEAMKGIGEKSGQYLYSNGHGPGNPPTDYIFFGEDAQTFYVGNSVIGKTLSPDPRDNEVHAYFESDRGFPEWGIRYATEPLRSNKYFRTYYRTVAGVTWDGFTLAARLMDAEIYWNHPPLFDYVERYINIVSGNEYQFNGTTWEVPGEGMIETQPGSDFNRNMWWKYWNNANG